MSRAKTPTFIAERRIYLEPFQYDYLERRMRICNKIYNTAVKHYAKAVELLREDLWYKKALSRFRASKTEEESREWSTELFACMEAYGLTEYGIHEYVGYQKKHAFNGSINIDAVQKLGTNLYAAVKKAVFSNTTIRFRKFGQTSSFEGKKATSAIIFNKAKDTVRVFGLELKLKPIRDKDTYLREAMEHKVKYCRIVRKPFKNSYRYFVQFALEGNSPKTVTLGNSRCGLDIGTSTVAYYNDTEAGFNALADGVEKYEQNIRKASVKYERRLRLANPSCYDENGVPIKGKKPTNRTKGSRRAIMELKNAYRLKQVFIKLSHNALANRIAKQCSVLIKEPMNFRKLAARAKNTARQQRQDAIKAKDGTIKLVHKYKKKKRFGKSIGRRAPGQFMQTLTGKIEQGGGYVFDVNPQLYKASQYNHITQTAVKSSLSERTKKIGSHTVQRDLYSSFLLYNSYDENSIDFKSCASLFNDFLKKQSCVISKIQAIGDTTKNFGLKAFSI